MHLQELSKIVLSNHEGILAELCRRRLSRFIKEAWSIVEPATPYVHNWHIDAISEHLEAVTRGEIQNLLINVPPGHMKSLIVGVFWQAWVWVTNPHWRFLNASYAQKLSMRDSVRCRSLITSEWYQALFNPDWQLTGDQNVKNHFENTATGFRVATSVGGSATGFRGNTIVVDDPINAVDSHSKTKREACITWFKEAFSNRLNSLETGSRVVIMQRLHERDLSGYLLSMDHWEHLCLPTEFESKRISISTIGWKDPRSKEGELLFPQMFPQLVIEKEKATLGGNGYAGQHQQRPAPEGGAVFMREWWQFYKELPELEEVIQSWDCAFKGTDGSDFVVGQVWGRKGSQKYLLAQVRDRMGYSATKQAIRMLSAKYPQARAKLVEDKANGIAVIDDLKRDITGLIPVEPQGGKEVRAYAVTPTIEAGNVFLPDPSLAPWVHDFVEECAAFPNGAYDDQVDAMTQALNRLNRYVQGTSIAYGNPNLFSGSEFRKRYGA